MATMTLEEALEVAARHRQAGRLAAAEELLRQILDLNSTHPEALHQLGLLSAQEGRKIEALCWIRQAIAANPAEANYHSNLGNVLQECGQAQLAIDAYRAALSLRPDIPEIHNNLANALQTRGEFDAAIAAYRQALALREAFPEAWFNMANALRNTDRPTEAIAAYRRAVGWRPNYPEAWNNLGTALFAAERHSDAAEAYERALAIQPNYVEARHNLGRALQQANQLDRAIRELKRAAELRPNDVEIHHDLGNVWKDAGQMDRAEAEFAEAIRLRPDFAEAHYGLAWVLLRRGEFERGWEEYEWRHRMRDVPPRSEDRSIPFWDGSAPAGRRILVTCEQGYGDSIQMARYIALLAERGGRVTLRCPQPLIRLFRTLAGVERLISDRDPRPEVDVQCSLMSLPRLFQTRLSTVPADIPYLTADPELRLHWRTLIGESDGRRQVGLVWAGNPIPRNRSIPPDSLTPLAAAAGVRFHSLQKGSAAPQARDLGAAGLDIIDWSDRLDDFADTAALIANLDLVISIDTAVAHLAGAIGKPVWVIPHLSEWRWLADREDSPWYPTMRIFRQTRPGNWSDPIARVVRELAVTTGRARS